MFFGGQSCVVENGGSKYTHIFFFPDPIRFSDPILHVHGLGVAASEVCVYPIEHLDVRQPRDRTVLLVDPRQDGVTTRPQIRVLVNV